MIINKKSFINLKFQKVPTKKKNFIGQCFLIDINSFPEKKIQKPKAMRKLDKLPSILVKDSTKIINTLSLQKSKSQSKKQIFQPNLVLNNQSSPLYKNTLDVNSSFDNKNKHNKKIKESNILQTESKKDYVPDAFVKRINELYYPKLSTIKYLTNLFDDNEKNDLKVINLSKIKVKNRRQSLFIKDLISKEYNNKRYRMNIKNKKISSFDEKNNQQINNAYKLTKAQLDKQLSNFHKLKIKMCKNKVKETLDDLMKLKNKNMAYVENFKKLCDFKFDDDLLL